MEQSSGSPDKRSRQRSEQEIFAAMEEFEKAGNISPKEFAEMHQISDATFYNWQRRYRSKDIIKEEPKGFIPVSVITNDDCPVEGEGLFAEVRVIKIYRWVEASYLKQTS